MIALDRDGHVKPELDTPWEAPAVVRVHPSGSDSWVGIFESGGLGGSTSLFATPDAERMCVLVGGQAFMTPVDAEDASRNTVTHFPVRQVYTAEDVQLLLLVSYTDVTAIGRTGTAWSTPRLAWDEVEVLSASKDGIRCRGFLGIGGESLIVLDPPSGAVVSGPRFG